LAKAKLREKKKNLNKWIRRREPEKKKEKKIQGGPSLHARESHLTVETNCYLLVWLLNKGNFKNIQSYLFFNFIFFLLYLVFGSEIHGVYFKVTSLTCQQHHLLICQQHRLIHTCATL
jgi:hypothetical protein